jgi:hypothetical protein
MCDYIVCLKVPKACRLNASNSFSERCGGRTASPAAVAGEDASLNSAEHAGTRRRARRSQKPYLDMLSDHPAQHTQPNGVDRHSAGLHLPVYYHPGAERGCPVGVNFDDVALT